MAPANSALKYWEVYGFVGLSMSVASAVLYVLWVAVPDETLQRWGVGWYPRKYWALSVPGTMLFIGITPFMNNLVEMWMNTPNLDSIFFLEDEFTCPTSTIVVKPCPSASIPTPKDIDIGVINCCLYGTVAPSL